MADYSPLTVESFHKRLLADKIILRKADIEAIVKEVENDHPGESEIVRLQKAYEKVEVLYQKVAAIRQANANYTGNWDGVEQRRTSA